MYSDISGKNYVVAVASYIQYYVKLMRHFEQRPSAGMSDIVITQTQSFYYNINNTFILGSILGRHEYLVFQEPSDLCPGILILASSRKPN